MVSPSQLLLMICVITTAVRQHGEPLCEFYLVSFLILLNALFNYEFERVLFLFLLLIPLCCSTEVTISYLAGIRKTLISRVPTTLPDMSGTCLTLMYITSYICYKKTDIQKII